MEMDDLSKKMEELMATHRENEAHLMRMMERQADLEAATDEMRTMMKEMAGRQIDLESLTKQVVENNIRISRIVEAHDYNIDELDARLTRLEQRRIKPN